MTLRLNPRDLSLLWATWQNRLMVPRQVHRRFWPDGTRQAASKRLNELKAAGLLHCAEFPWNPDRRFYAITPAGNRVLVRLKALTPSQVGDSPRLPKVITRNIVEDLSVVDLRIAFELNGADGSTWVSDHELRLGRPAGTGNPKAVDGVFHFRTATEQGRGVLEFERQATHRRWFIDRLARLRFHHEQDTVFYVCRSTERARTVWRWSKACAFLTDRKAHFRVAPMEFAVRDGLKSEFADLRG